MTDWDSFGYLKHIYTHSRSGLLLGRLGFIGFFIPIWELCSKFFKMPILEFYNVIITADIIFSSLTIFLVYLVTRSITRNKLVALGSTVILIFSRDFIRLAGDVLTEPMMIFTVILSYFCYIKSINKKNLFYFYLSAFIFGCAFEVREAALFSILFFPAFLSTRKESEYFSVKNHLFFILIFLATAFILPFYCYLKGGNNYIHDIFYRASYFKFGCNFQVVYRAMNSGFGNLLFPLVGFIMLLFRREFAKLLIIFTLFIPNIIFSFLPNSLSRYFVFGYIALSILTAYCFFYIVRYAMPVLKFFHKRSSLLFAILLIWLLAPNFNNFYGQLIKDKKYSKYLQDYGLKLLNNFPENTIFIIGDRSALMGQYYIPLTKSRKKIISSGWDWPHEKLGEVVEDYLSNGKKIIIDLAGFKPLSADFQDEERDLMKLLLSYKTKEIGNNLVELHK
jgi:hypothetical protein